MRIDILFSIHMTDLKHCHEQKAWEKQKTTYWTWMWCNLRVPSQVEEMLFCSFHLLQTFIPWCQVELLTLSNLAAWIRARSSSAEASGKCRKKVVDEMIWGWLNPCWIQTQLNWVLLSSGMASRKKGGSSVPQKGRILTSRQHARVCHMQHYATCLCNFAELAHFNELVCQCLRQTNIIT